jgi:orotidine-5'-phosphate decarboxylase
MNVDSPLILAIDRLEVDDARELIEQTAPSIGVFKFGLEFYLRNGIQSLIKIKEDYSGIRIFLDLKLHDIPNTIKGAAEAVSEIEPEILTVHAAGGKEMIRSAVAMLPRTMIAAVTVLTSLKNEDLFGMGIENPAEDLVISLAKLAEQAGARAVVSSPLEIRRLRQELPNQKLITPGIRETGSSSDDQSRTMTAKEALAAGADFLVIGRPITRAARPGDAAASIYESLK